VYFYYLFQLLLCLLSSGLCLILLLAVIGLYRVSDIVLGVVANIFYQDMGFSKIEIATVSKTFGLFMTVAGGFLGGLMAIRFGVFKVLFLGAALSAITNLLAKNKPPAPATNMPIR
jgi:hypothetical protein